MIRRTVESISLLKLVIIFLLIGITIVLALVVLGVLPIPFMSRGESGNQKMGIFDSKPGSCLVLEQKFCDQLVLKDSTTYPGEKIAYAKLPVGTKIFNPEDATVEASNKFVLVPKVGGKNKFEWGYNVTSNLQAQGARPLRLYNIIFFVNPDNQISRRVTIGEVIGQIEQESLLTIKDYNFAFIVSEFNEGSKKYINTTQTFFNK